MGKLIAYITKATPPWYVVLNLILTSLVVVLCFVLRLVLTQLGLVSSTWITRWLFPTAWRLSRLFLTQEVPAVFQAVQRQEVFIPHSTLSS